MTITIRVAASGESAALALNGIKCDLDTCIDKDGKPNHEKLLKVLDAEYINCGSNDSPQCLAIGATILNSFIHYCTSVDGVTDSTDKEEDVEQLTGADRKMHKGKYGFCRIYVLDNANDTIVVRVRYDNPKKVVGSVFDAIKDFAVTICRVALNVSAQYELNKASIKIVVKDYKGCEGVVEEAMRIDHKNQLKLKRKQCPHKTPTDFCSSLPDGTLPNFNCELYCNGKCKLID